MNILFVCTHNRCRSILAEAITRHICNGNVSAGNRNNISVASAGSSPVGEVHPLTLATLERHNIPSENLKSKSWDSLAGINDGFDPDVVITVCDKANQEPCPIWIGDALKVHWGLSDPSQVSGSTGEIKEAFDSTIAIISERVTELNGWDIGSMSAEILQKQLAALA